MSYKAKGLFIITSDLGHNSFEVQRYDKPSSAKRKYKNTELYLLPPALFPSKPLDTIDQRYLDSRNAPIVNPLKKTLRIELYNNKWLQSKGSIIPTLSSTIDQASSAYDAVAFTPHDHISSNTKQTSESTATLPCTSPNHAHSTTGISDVDMERPSSNSDDAITAIPRSMATESHQDTLLHIPTLHSTITQSKDKLCFISYTPTGTMLRR